MEPTIPWYKSAILRQQIVQAAVALTALIGVNTETIDLDATVASIFAGIAGVIALWTFITRLVKPAPNLTATAQAKEEQLVQDGKLPRQGGFFRPGAALLVLAISTALALGVGAMSGCANTKAAYKEASGITETAYVVAEHYAALVNQAANLAQLPTTAPEAKEAMKAADNAVRPLILGDPARGLPSLQTLVDRYDRVRTAQTQTELQNAINAAVLELANLINAVKQAARSQ